MKNPIWGMVDTEADSINGDDRQEEDKPKVEVHNNRIYFFAEIDRAGVFILVKALRALTAKHLYEQVYLNRVQPDPIWVHISSRGGHVLDGITGMDAIRETIKRGITVNTVIDGYCASAGTLLSVVGSRRYINPAAYMLIHQLSSAMWGKFEECKDDMQNLEELMVMMRGVYGRYTTMSDEQLAGILKRDIWFNPTKCLECGLVDEIL